MDPKTLKPGDKVKLTTACAEDARRLNEVMTVTKVRTYCCDGLCDGVLVDLELDHPMLPGLVLRPLLCSTCLEPA